MPRIPQRTTDPLGQNCAGLGASAEQPCPYFSSSPQAKRGALHTRHPQASMTIADMGCRCHSAPPCSSAPILQILTWPARSRQSMAALALSQQAALVEHASRAGCPQSQTPSCTTLHDPPDPSRYEQALYKTNKAALVHSATYNCRLQDNAQWRLCQRLSVSGPLSRGGTLLGFADSDPSVPTWPATV